jgi:hypothetical protein
MIELILLVIGIVVGAILAYFITNKWFKNKSASKTEVQASVLLDKIKTVCKLVVVEGEFAEIYNHKQNKDYLFGLFSSSKKALVIVNAKVHVGFDLKKILLSADTNKKTIILKQFPEPEVISFENNFKFYDIEDGIFNKFKPEELSQINEDSKQFILEKIPNSSLMETAKKEAMQSIFIMENIVQTIGWKLDYSTLKIESKDINLLN